MIRNIELIGILSILIAKIGAWHYDLDHPISICLVFWRSDYCRRDIKMSDHMEFFVGFSSKPNSLPDMITQLRDASALFCAAWSTRNNEQASRASERAMKAFDHICNVFLRARDDAKGHNNPSEDLAKFMGRLIGLLASPVTRAEQQENSGQPSNFGNGRLPNRPQPYEPAVLHAAFNKIKHRNDLYSNFRIENNRHILTIAGDLNGKPNYIFEFDVIEFCNVCDEGLHLVSR